MKIYLLKLRSINIYNLLLAQLYENAGDQVFNPCRFTVNNQGFLDISVIGDFAKSQANNPEKDFRYIDWTASLDTLDNSINQATTQNQYLIFGSYHNKQIEFLKNHYGSKLMTIGINYQENFYPQLLKHKAKYHLHLLTTNQLPASELDQQLIASLSSEELVNYYSNAFNEQNLIPCSDVDVYDYNVNLDDFYKKDLMTQHLNNIGIPFTSATEQFYDQWLKLQ
jgi:hypothetical protein